MIELIQIMFVLLVDEESSQGFMYTLPKDVINELKKDEDFIEKLRLGVRLMVRSWGWVRIYFLFILFFLCQI